MIRKTMITLSIALMLESIALGASAFAYSGSNGGTFRGAQSADSARMADQGYRGDKDRASGRRREFRASGDHDVWGHWGNYYGPLVHGPL
jgi:hypothetical protein